MRKYSHSFGYAIADHVVDYYNNSLQAWLSLRRYIAAT